MLEYLLALARTVLLLFTTWFYGFLQPKKSKPHSITLQSTSGRSKSSSVGTQCTLGSSSRSRENLIPEYIPVYKSSGNVSARSPEFKVPAPKFNKSRLTESRRGEKESRLNVTRSSLDLNSSSSSETSDSSDEDAITYPRPFKAVRKPMVKPTSLSVTQTPKRFRPVLESSPKVKKRKRRSSADREKKRKRRLACESISSLKGATVTVKRRKWNKEETENAQKKRSLSLPVENGTSRRLKVNKIDASALYDHSYDVDCGLTLSPSRVGTLIANPLLVDVRPAKLRTT